MVNLGSKGGGVGLRGGNQVVEWVKQVMNDDRLWSRRNKTVHLFKEK